MIKLAIDFGSSMTKIYRADTGNGIVLVEPSCVAVTGEDREIRAIGKQAKKLIGKTAGATSIVYPVHEGKIVDSRLAAEMLKEFLNRIGLKGLAFKRSVTVFSVPCGLPEGALDEYRTVAKECGLKQVKFVSAPFLSAIGSDAVLSEVNPVCCLDIGGGVTNMAVLSTDGVIVGFSMNLGGRNMDVNVQKVLEYKGLRIGMLTAERIKNEIGSLSKNARGTTLAEGRSVYEARPHSVSVEAAEISPCIRIYIDKILEYTAQALQQLPAEVAATVNQNGIYLSGGVMKLSGVADYIASRLKMTAHVCEEPQFACILGGGNLVRDKKLLDRLALKNEQ